MSYVNPITPIPRYPPSSLITDDRLKSAINDLKSRITSFICATLPDEVETIPNVTAIKAVYGGGKTHLVLRLIYELRHIDELKDRATLIDYNHYVKALPNLTQNGKNPVLAVYITFNKILEEEAISYITHTTILRHIVRELRNKTLECNKELKGTLSREFENTLLALETESDPSRIMEELKKHYSRVVIVLDEMESVLHPILTTGVREALFTGLLNFFNTQCSAFLLISFPEETWTYMLAFTPMINRMGAPIELGEFSFTIAEKIIDEAFESIKKPNPFQRIQLYTIWELMKRGGRNFLWICRKAYDQAKMSERDKVVYDDIATEIVLGFPMDAEESRRVLDIELWNDLKQKLSSEDWNILTFLIGELKAHSEENITEKIGIDRTAVDKFAKKYSTRNLELAIPGSLIVTCTKLPRMDRAKQDAFIEKFNLLIDDQRRIVGVEKTLTEIINTLPYDPDEPQFMYLPTDPGEFNKMFPRAETSALNELHSFLIKEGVEIAGIRLSPSAQNTLIGTPVRLPTAAELIIDPAVREDVSRSLRTFDTDTKSFEATRGLEILAEHMAEKQMLGLATIDRTPKAEVLLVQEGIKVLFCVSAARRLSAEHILNLYGRITEGEIHGAYVFYVGDPVLAQKAIVDQQTAVSFTTKLVSLVRIKDEQMDFLIILSQLKNRNIINDEDKVDQRIKRGNLSGLSIGLAPNKHLKKFVKDLEEEGLVLRVPKVIATPIDKLVFYSSAALEQGDLTAISDEVKKLNQILELESGDIGLPRIARHIPEFERSNLLTKKDDLYNFHVPPSIARIISIFINGKIWMVGEIETEIPYIYCEENSLSLWLDFLQTWKVIRGTEAVGFSNAPKEDFQNLLKETMRNLGKLKKVRPDSLFAYVKQKQCYNPLINDAPKYYGILKELLKEELSTPQKVIKTAILACLIEQIKNKTQNMLVKSKEEWKTGKKKLNDARKEERNIEKYLALRVG